MKKQNLKKQLKTFFTLTLIGITMLSACKKNQLQESSQMSFIHPTNFATKAEAYKYINEQLNTYGLVFTELAKNPQVKTLVHEEVAKRFDGDDNVLIKTLFKSAEKRGIDLKGLFAKVLKNKNLNITVEQLLASFDNLNGRNLYPQIYIPNFEKFEQNQDLVLSKESRPDIGTNKSSTLNDRKLSVIPPPNGYDNPVIVPYDGSEDLEPLYYIGHTTQNDGTQINNIRVTEAYAESNEIWVITNNESYIIDDETSVIPPTVYPTDGAQAAYFSTMIVKAHKESWIKGASEIFITYMQSFDDGIKPSTGLYHHALFESKYTQFQANDPYPYFKSTDQIILGTFLRRDIRNQNEKQLDVYYAVFGTPTSFVQNLGEFNNTRDWYSKHGDYIYYTIFERDSWVDYIEDVRVANYLNVTNQYMPVPVYSNNPIYCKGAIKIVPYGSFNGPQINGMTSNTTVNNNEISFVATHKP